MASGKHVRAIYIPLNFYVEKLGFAQVDLIFLFLILLEPPRRGDFNMHPQYMFIILKISKFFNFYILGKICIKHGHIFVMGILGLSATVPMLQGPERGPVSLRLFLPFEANTKIIEMGE